MNSMEENDVAMALYNASQAGVDITMVVRGFCCLRPGVKGLSERLRVLSCIGRFLEHSRMFYFRNGAADPLDGEFYIGSADWMYRNLHARVECIVPIFDRALREKLWDLIQLHENDQRQTWDMNSDGNYKQRSGSEVGVHQHLMSAAKLKSVVIEDEPGDAGT
jgi:polyphosphate kinase